MTNYDSLIRNASLMFYGRDNKKYFLVAQRVYQEVKTRTGGVTLRRITKL